MLFSLSIKADTVKMYSLLTAKERDAVFMKIDELLARRDIGIFRYYIPASSLYPALGETKPGLAPAKVDEGVKAYVQQTIVNKNRALLSIGLFDRAVQSSPLGYFIVPGSHVSLELLLMLDDIKNAWTVNALTERLQAKFDDAKVQQLIDANRQKIIIPLFVEYLAKNHHLKTALQKPATLKELLDTNLLVSPLREELYNMRFSQTKTIHQRDQLLTNLLDNIVSQGFLIKHNNMYQLNDENCFTAYARDVYQNRGNTGLANYLNHLQRALVPATTIEKIRQSVLPTPQAKPAKKSEPVPVEKPQQTATVAVAHTVATPYIRQVFPAAVASVPEKRPPVSLPEKLERLFSEILASQKDLSIVLEDIITHARQELPATIDKRYGWLMEFFTMWKKTYTTYLQKLMAITDTKTLPGKVEALKDICAAASRIDRRVAIVFIDQVIEDLNVLAQHWRTQTHNLATENLACSEKILAVRNSIHATAIPHLSNIPIEGSLFDETR